MDEKYIQNPFLGPHPRKLDDKHRVPIPAEFRRYFQAQEVYTYRSNAKINGSSLTYIVFAEEAIVRETLAQLSSCEPDDPKRIERVTSLARKVMDGQGRVSLTEEEFNYLGNSYDLVFYGNIDRFLLTKPING